jgi:hypothetical protein
MKFLKILFYIFAIIIIIIISIQLFFTFYFDRKIISEIKRQVEESSRGEYQIQIESIHTNIFTQSVHISEFVFSPVSKKKTTAAMYSFSAGQINFDSFNVWSFLFYKNLIVGKIDLMEPVIHIYRGKPVAVKDSTETFSTYKIFKNQFHSLTVHNIQINNADFNIYNHAGDMKPFLSSRENRLSVSNLRIDQKVDSMGRFFLADTMDMVINKFSFITRDSLYSIDVKSMTAVYTDSIMIFDSLQIIPLYSKKDFARKAGKQTDRLFIKNRDIRLTHMDVKSFFEAGSFIAKKIQVADLDINAYRDKNDKAIPVRSKTIPGIIRSIPFYLAIDTVSVKNATVIYEEVSKGSVYPGKLLFTNCNAELTGITNDSSLYDSQEKLHCHLQGMLMNKGKINVFMDFPLSTSATLFNCSGKLNTISFSDLNPFVEQNASISMKEGVIDSLSFAFKANEIHSTGTMKFIYHDLKIELLNQKTKQSNIFKDAMSVFAHKLILKEDNPKGNNPVRESSIDINRDTTKFIFNYCWRSLLSGIKPVVGIPKNNK